MPVPDRAVHATAPSFLPQGGAAPAQGGLPLSGVTILLVEDSRSASDMLRMMCQRSGARLRRADCLEQARSHLRTYCPDVVIVDLGLPDGCGDQLIRELATAGRDMLVLGLSGDPDGRRLALAAGAQGFLAKPVAGLGVFQAAILQHLPGLRARTGRRYFWGQFVPPLPEWHDPAVARCDPLALRDDLTHAADLLAKGPDAAARAYLARFVAGIARSAGDAALAEAAQDAALRAEALPRLQRLVQHRLGEAARF
ncbi:MAG: response regulator [Pseudotabrizicola sp.]|uniref:response regulator n=1 Tax=Pseudotabrizicola sp. TaxID=2939647 RepID=UPI00271E49BD|nr:response regulator [Pseudotabrizicola sp.]MDO9640183.1 response regulator [Pseudotabrizicola sp.]